MQSTRRPMVFRRSRRRLHRLRVRDHGSVELSWLLFALILGVWLALRLVQHQNIEPGLHYQPETASLTTGFVSIVSACILRTTPPVAARYACGTARRFSDVSTPTG